MAKRGNPAWKKGVSGNPAGGSKHRSEFRADFEEAVQEVETEKKKSFFKHCIEESWNDNQLMKEVLRKLVPDLKGIELKVEDVRKLSREDVLNWLQLAPLDISVSHSDISTIIGCGLQTDARDAIAK